MKKETTKEILAIIIGLVVGSIFGATIVSDVKPKTLLESYQIIEIEVEKDDKYGDCTVRDSGDLLQPSGLWINYTLNCWKLEKTRQEYCDELKADESECFPTN